MITAKQLTEARKYLVKSYEKRSKIKEDCNKEKRRLEYEVYGPKIDKLKTELSKKTQSLEERAEKKISIINEDIKKNIEVTHEATKIFTLMEIAKSEDSQRGDKRAKVFKYSDRDAQGNYISKKIKVYYNSVSTVFEDNYTSVLAFIVPNGKPVNKFSLILRGYSIFGNKGSLFYTRCCYITKVQDVLCNIEINVKDARTEKELRKYLEKSTEKVLNMLPSELLTLPKEYEEATKLWDDPEWEAAYLEHKRVYYEGQYSGGTETPEYKAIVKRLEELQQAEDI